MKNIPLLGHTGIKANYKSLYQHALGGQKGNDPQPPDEMHLALKEKIEKSKMSKQDKAALAELVRSALPELQPCDEETFIRHIDYLIRLKETRVKE